MTKKILTSSDFLNIPWKNGGGQTRELFCSPPRNESEIFDFRLSVAKVEKNGPFSHFAQIDRTLILLKGAGFQLQKKSGALKVNKAFEPHSLPGEEAIECHLLEGPCQDFNVMVRRSFGKTSTRCLFHHQLQEQKILIDSMFIYLVEKDLLYHFCLGETLSPSNIEKDNFPLIIVELHQH